MCFVEQRFVLIVTVNHIVLTLKKRERERKGLYIVCQRERETIHRLNNILHLSTTTYICCLFVHYFLFD